MIKIMNWPTLAIFSHFICCYIKGQGRQAQEHTTLHFRKGIATPHIVSVTPVYKSTHVSCPSNWIFCWNHERIFCVIFRQPTMLIISTYHYWKYWELAPVFLYAGCSCFNTICPRLTKLLTCHLCTITNGEGWFWIDQVISQVNTPIWRLQTLVFSNTPFLSAPVVQHLQNYQAV